MQTLVFTHPERFADVLRVRKNVDGGSASHLHFEIHSLKEVRLAADAPMLKAAGPEYEKRPIMSVETEVMNLSTDEVDAGIWVVPSGFERVEFQALLTQKVLRDHH